MQRVLEPPSAESIRAIRELISAAIGVVPDRDQLVIESLPFESTLNEQPPRPPVSKPSPTPAAQPWLWPSVMDRRLEAGIILALVAAAAFLVLRKRKKTAVKRAPAAPAELPPSQTSAALSAGADAPAVAMPNLAKSLTAAEQATRVAKANRMEAMVEDVRKNITSDPALAANVIRTWLEEHRQA